MKCNYRHVYPPQYLDVIACNPPSTQFSEAMKSGPKRLDHASAVVQKALEIVDCVQPELWILENPQKGLLKSRGYMVGIPFVDIDYARSQTGAIRSERDSGVRRWSDVCHQFCATLGLGYMCTLARMVGSGTPRS